MSNPFLALLALSGRDQAYVDSQRRPMADYGGVY